MARDGWRAGGWLLWAWSVWLLAASPASARSIEVQAFQATLEVDASGVVAVEERIVFDFQGSWNGIYREIPYGYTYPSGVRGQIRLVLDAVEDDTGNALGYEERWRRGRLRLKIRVPGARDARRTVVLRYRAEHVVRRVRGVEAEFGMRDELYWNVTGDGWQFPIHEASAVVRLPDGVPAAGVTATAFTGPAGARGTDHQIAHGSGAELTFRTSRGLPPYSGLTIVVGLPPGHVAQPSLLRRTGWLVAANGLAALPLGLLALWGAIWWRRGRDPLRDRTIVPQWDAPLDLRPSEVGMLIDGGMDQRDLTASLFDLAVRGVLTIHESRSTSGKPDYRLVLDEGSLDGAGLETFEEALIDGLFGGRSEVTLGSLERKFADRAARVGGKVSEDLVVKGLFRARPERVRATWIALTCVALAAAVPVGIIAEGPLTFWGALVLCAAPMLLFAWHMPQRTKLGLDALAQVKGLEEYLATAERERLESIPLQQIERLLPYAIALNLHERWTETFSGMFGRSPRWYVAQDGAWSPQSLGAVVGNVGRSVSTNLYSVPRSEGRSGWGGGHRGGSGFSGGGRSGGGFGGGGGGGW